MTRLVKKTVQAPQQVGDKWVCMCGLSRNQPFCDSSHKLTAGEEKDKLYMYTKNDRIRKEIKAVPESSHHHRH